MVQQIYQRSTECLMRRDIRDDKKSRKKDLSRIAEILVFVKNKIQTDISKRRLFIWRAAGNQSFAGIR